MAVRASEAEVLAIMDTALTDEQITPFLEAANELVSAILSNEGYGDNLLKNIEVWLTAHLVSSRDPQVQKEKIGKAEATYHGQSGLGLDQTPYGQNVKLLDYKGKLAALSSRSRKTVIRVYGEDTDA